MALFLEPGGTEDFTLDCVTFEIRKLTAREMMKLQHTASQIGADFTPDDYDLTLDLLRIGLAGWRGDSAPPVHMDDLVISEKSLDLLTLETASRLAQEIFSLNGMTDTDRGNSHSSSQPDSGEPEEPDV